MNKKKIYPLIRLAFCTIIIFTLSGCYGRYANYPYESELRRHFPQIDSIKVSYNVPVGPSIGIYLRKSTDDPKKIANQIMMKIIEQINNGGLRTLQNENKKQYGNDSATFRDIYVDFVVVGDDTISLQYETRIDSNFQIWSFWDQKTGEQYAFDARALAATPTGETS